MSSEKKQPQLNLIAEGSYGTVYKEKNKKEEDVAKKVISNDFSSNSLRFNLRELAYLRTFTKLDVPSMISILDYDIKLTISKAIINIYMPLADTTLRTFLERHDFEYRNFCLPNFALQILEGIAFLEKNNLIHGDLKPENILLFHTNDSIPKLKLCDLGLIINFDNLPEGKLTSDQYGDNYICQTLGFQAPETIIVNNDSDEIEEDDIHISIKTDIWSVGMTLVSILTGVSSYRYFQYDEKIIKYDENKNKKDIDEIVLGTYLDNMTGDNLEHFFDVESYKYSRMEKQINTFYQLPEKTKFNWYLWVTDYNHKFNKINHMIDNWEEISEHLLIVLDKIFYLHPEERYSASELISLLDPYREIQTPIISEEESNNNSLRDLWLENYLDQKFNAEEDKVDDNVEDNAEDNAEEDTENKNILDLRHQELARLYQFLNLTSYSELHHLKHYWILTSEILDRYILTLPDSLIENPNRLDFKKMALASMVLTLIFYGNLEKYYFTKHLIFFFYKRERDLNSSIIQEIYHEVIRMAVSIFRALDTNIYHSQLKENFINFSKLDTFRQLELIEKNKKLFGSVVELNSNPKFQ